MRRAIFAICLLAVLGLTAPGAQAAKKGSAPKKGGVKAEISGKTLEIAGNGKRNVIVLRLRGKGKRKRIVVDVKGKGARDFRFSPAKFKNIVLKSRGGNDLVRIDEKGPAFTGRGRGREVTTIDGGGGNDSIFGGRGGESLRGNVGADTIDGGGGDDSALLGKGDDVLVWNPGDGADIVVGGPDTDRLAFNGSSAADSIDLTLSPNPNSFHVLRGLEPGPVAADEVETVGVNPLGGADRISFNSLAGSDVAALGIDLAGAKGGSLGDAQADTITVNGLAGKDDIKVSGGPSGVNVSGPIPPISVVHPESADALTIDGQGGDDLIDASALAANALELTLLGGPGLDSLVGSPGNDRIGGGPDDDDNLAGADGNDVLTWNAGDGSDVFEGGPGADSLAAAGTDGADSLSLGAIGERLAVVRGPDPATADAKDVETVRVSSLGGPDGVTVGDLLATDVDQVDVDLSASAGGGAAGDAQADSLVVNAGNGEDALTVTGGASGVNLDGFGPGVAVTGADGGGDSLVLNALAEDDVIDAGGLQAGAIGLTVNGGLGADVLVGSAGGDLLNGGDGNDLALMGAGDDVLVWNPGDDNDTFEGQAGADTLRFNGSNAAETIDISPNGGRVIFFRNVANVLMDMNDVEVIDYRAIGGADTVVVNDLTATDVIDARVDLAGTLGGSAGDAAPDSLVLSGTNGEDVVTIDGGPAGVDAVGLVPTLSILNAEAASDRLTVNGLGGDDVIDATAIPAGSIALTLNGDDDDDALFGGDGPDIVNGGNGNDVLIGNGGIDALDGGPGSNVVIQ